MSRSNKTHSYKNPKAVKNRNFIAKELWTNALFKPKTIPDKKNMYTRRPKHQERYSDDY